jgi:hypothetical protein
MFLRLYFIIRYDLVKLKTFHGILDFLGVSNAAFKRIKG